MDLTRLRGRGSPRGVCKAEGWARPLAFLAPLAQVARGIRPGAGVQLPWARREDHRPRTLRQRRCRSSVGCREHRASSQACRRTCLLYSRAVASKCEGPLQKGGLGGQTSPTHPLSKPKATRTSLQAVLRLEFKIRPGEGRRKPVRAWSAVTPMRSTGVSRAATEPPASFILGPSGQ